MDLTSATIEKIISLAPVEIQEIDGRKYSSKQLNPLTEPQVEAVKMHSLDGLLSLADHQKIDGAQFYVVSPTKVALCGGIEKPWNTRQTYAVSSCYECNFEFGNFYPQDEFLIKLMTQFKDSENRVDVFKIAGNVTKESTAKRQDDGISQTVTVREGARFEMKAIPNPVKLAPFRTFREIEQPVSEFILRYKDEARFALFDAAGDGWKYQAIEAIASYLKKGGLSYPIYY